MGSFPLYLPYKVIKIIAHFKFWLCAFCYTWQGLLLICLVLALGLIYFHLSVILTMSTFDITEFIDADKPLYLSMFEWSFRAKGLLFLSLAGLVALCEL